MGSNRTQYKKYGRLLIFAVMFLLLNAGTVWAASKKAVYVVTKVKDKVDVRSADHFAAVSDPASYAESRTMSYKYTSAGLISKVNFGTETVSYIYDAQNRFLKKNYRDRAKTSRSDRYQHDKKGRVSRILYYDSQTTDLKYSKKGYLTDCGDGCKYWWDGKGRVDKKTIRTDYQSETWNYSYDSRGSWKKAVQKMKAGGSTYRSSYQCENTYQSGRLKKQKITVKNGITGNDETVTRVFYYRKVNVPLKLYKRIRAQQRWILLNGSAIPFHDSYAVRLEAVNK